MEAGKKLSSPGACVYFADIVKLNVLSLLTALLATGLQIPSADCYC